MSGVYPAALVALTALRAAPALNLEAGRHALLIELRPLFLWLAHGLRENLGDGHLVLVGDVIADRIRPRVADVPIVLLIACRGDVLEVGEPPRLARAVQCQGLGP